LPEVDDFDVVSLPLVGFATVAVPSFFVSPLSAELVP